MIVLDQKAYSLLGIIGPLVAYISVATSIALSPWFSWERSALSDLGHTIQSGIAPIFNLGLMLAGFLVTVYVVTVFRRHAKCTSFFLVTSAFSLQLVAAFDEVYGLLHLIVSVSFFVSLGAASVIYAIEKKSYLAVAASLIGLSIWMLYGLRMYHVGIAVPETISSAVAAVWIIFSAVKIYAQKDT